MSRGALPTSDKEKTQSKERSQVGVKYSLCLFRPLFGWMEGFLRFGHVRTSALPRRSCFFLQGLYSDRRQALHSAMGQVSPSDVQDVNPTLWNAMLRAGLRRGGSSAALAGDWLHLWHGVKPDGRSEGSSRQQASQVGSVYVCPQP